MIYNNKHVVFEQVGVEDTGYRWNSSTNTDSDGCFNNYEISEMRNSVLNQTIISHLSNNLQNELSSTTIQTVKNGKSSILVSTTNKLFIPASKEVGYTTYSISAENNALITWQYYVSHTTTDEHKKYNSSSTPLRWWNRSACPDVGGIKYVCGVNQLGSATTLDTTDSTRYVSCCFAW